jgi:hypothetical protein
VSTGKYSELKAKQLPHFGALAPPPRAAARCVYVQLDYLQVIALNSALKLTTAHKSHTNTNATQKQPSRTLRPRTPRGAGCAGARGRPACPTGINATVTGINATVTGINATVTGINAPESLIHSIRTCDLDHSVNVSYCRDKVWNKGLESCLQILRLNSVPAFRDSQSGARDTTTKVYKDNREEEGLRTNEGEPSNKHALAENKSHGSL